jgi:hypothetical protein
MSYRPPKKNKKSKSTILDDGPVYEPITSSSQKLKDLDSLESPQKPTNLISPNSEIKEQLTPNTEAATSVSESLFESSVPTDSVLIPPTENKILEEPILNTQDSEASQAFQPALDEEFKTPVVEAAKTPVVEAAKTPVVEAAKTPVVEANKPPVVESVKTPVVEADKPPVVESVKTPVVEAVKTPVVEAEKTPETNPTNRQLDTEEFGTSKAKPFVQESELVAGTETPAPVLENAHDIEVQVTTPTNHHKSNEEFDKKSQLSDPHRSRENSRSSVSKCFDISIVTDTLVYKTAYYSFLQLKLGYQLLAKSVSTA